MSTWSLPGTVRPGAVSLLEMVATARATATAVTHDLIAPLLTEQMTGDLDLLPRVDAGLGMTRSAWLTKPAVDATATSIKTSIEKLTWVRGMDGHLIDLSMLAAERRRFLATIGRRSTGQGLARREAERRYPILLTLVAQSATDLLDEVVGLFDQAVSARYRDFLTRAQRQNDDVSYRHYWELCVLLGVRDGLRSVMCSCPAAGRYADPGSYLFTPQAWESRREEFCALVGKPADGRAGLQQGLHELRTALGDLERVLADTGPDKVGSDLHARL